MLDQEVRMRVLVVEDTPDIQEILVEALRSAKMWPEVVEDGLNADTALAIAHASGNHYDCVVLDLTLSGMDGLDVLRAMRKRDDKTPVLILSARSSTEERVSGLDAGADDYMAKPFAFSEVIARIRAVVRRRPSFIEVPPQVGNLVYEPQTGFFVVDGQSMKLTARQRSILEALYRRAGSMIPKQRLQELTPEDISSAEAVDVQISRLRKTFQEHGCDASIVTHYGIGYSLERPSS